MGNCQFFGETFKGKAKLNILNLGGDNWRVVIEQLKPDEEGKETHMFCFVSKDREEASMALQQILSSPVIYESEVENFGFYYL